MDDIIAAGRKGLYYASKLGSLEAMRDERSRLVEQLEGLRDKLRCVRKIVNRDSGMMDGTGRCGVLRLYKAYRRLEMEIVDLFGSRFSQYTVLLGPFWYVIEVTRLESALALELAIHVAAAFDSDPDVVAGNCSKLRSNHKDVQLFEDTLKDIILKLNSQVLKKNRKAVVTPS